MQERIDSAILSTTTGEVRNLLCDLNIEMQVADNRIVLTPDDLGELHGDTKFDQVSVKMFKSSSITRKEILMAHIIVYVDGDNSRVLKNRF